MIAKTVQGKGFKGVLNYNSKGILLSTNFASSDIKTQLAEVAAVRALRPNLKNAVQHTALSLSAEEKDKLTDQQWQQVAFMYMQKMGFDLQNQFAIFKHDDTENPHIHIVINRIKTNGEVVSDSKTWERQSVIMREIEQHFGLKIVQVPPKHERQATVSKEEAERYKRTGELAPKLVIAGIIDEALKSKPDLQTFVEILALSGVEVKLKRNEETREIKGISFNYGEQNYTGTGIGRAYSFNGLIKKGLDYGVDTRDKNKATTNANSRDNDNNERTETSSERLANNNTASIADNRESRIASNAENDSSTSASDRIDKQQSNRSAGKTATDFACRSDKQENQDTSERTESSSGQEQNSTNMADFMRNNVSANSNFQLHEAIKEAQNYQTIETENLKMIDLKRNPDNGFLVAIGKNNAFIIEEQEDQAHATVFKASSTMGISRVFEVFEKALDWCLRYFGNGLQQEQKEELKNLQKMK